MDAIPESILAGGAAVFLGGVTGMILFKLISAEHYSACPSDVGRKFAAWGALLVSVTSFGRIFINGGVNAFFAWLLLLIVVGFPAYALVSRNIYNFV